MLPTTRPSVSAAISTSDQAKTKSPAAARWAERGHAFFQNGAKRGKKSPGDVRSVRKVKRHAEFGALAQQRAGSCDRRWRATSTSSSFASHGTTQLYFWAIRPDGLCLQVEQDQSGHVILNAMMRDNKPWAATDDLLKARPAPA
jgi:hypothetical protein